MFFFLIFNELEKRLSIKDISVFQRKKITQGNRHVFAQDHFLPWGNYQCHPLNMWLQVMSELCHWVEAESQSAQTSSACLSASIANLTVYELKGHLSPFL